MAFLTTINTGFFLFTLVDTEHLCHKFLSSNFGYFKSFFCISNFHFLFLSSSSGIHICYITYIKIYMLEKLIFNISLVFVLIFYYLSSLFFFFFVAGLKLWSSYICLPCGCDYRYVYPHLAFFWDERITYFNQLLLVKI